MTVSQSVVPLFLDATTRLYERPYLSVRRSIPEPVHSFKHQPIHRHVHSALYSKTIIMNFNHGKSSNKILDNIAMIDDKSSQIS